MKVWNVERPYTGSEGLFKTKEKAKRFVENEQPNGYWKGDQYYLTKKGAMTHHVIYNRLPEYYLEQIEVK